MKRIKLEDWFAFEHFGFPRVVDENLNEALVVYSNIERQIYWQVNQTKSR